GEYIPATIQSPRKDPSANGAKDQNLSFALHQFFLASQCRLQNRLRLRSEITAENNSLRKPSGLL
ncbi:MAG: hypothetical protein ACREE6_10520, partial [Limisphaerales bacterium]